MSINRLKPFDFHTLSNMSTKKIHDEDDALLYQDEDNDMVIQPGQPDPLNLEEPTDCSKKTNDNNNRATKLTPENWNVVRRLSNRSREIIGARERTKHLLKRSELQVEQSIRPNWMVCRQNPPLLPGSVAFNGDFHQEWAKVILKFEKRLIKKVVKHLPNSISALDTRLQTHKKSAQDTIRREILDPSQRERAIGLFLRFSNQAEQGFPPARQPSHLNHRR